MLLEFLKFLPSSALLPHTPMLRDTQQPGITEPMHFYHSLSKLLPDTLRTLTPFNFSEHSNSPRNFNAILCDNTTTTTSSNIAVLVYYRVSSEAYKFFVYRPEPEFIGENIHYIDHILSMFNVFFVISHDSPFEEPANYSVFDMNARINQLLTIYVANILHSGNVNPLNLSVFSSELSLESRLLHTDTIDTDAYIIYVNSDFTTLYFPFLEARYITGTQTFQHFARDPLPIQVYSEFPYVLSVQPFLMTRHADYTRSILIEHLGIIPTQLDYISPADLHCAWFESYISASLTSPPHSSRTHLLSKMATWICCLFQSYEHTALSTQILFDDDTGELRILPTPVATSPYFARINFTMSYADVNYPCQFSPIDTNLKYRLFDRATHFIRNLPSSTNFEYDEIDISMFAGTIASSSSSSNSPPPSPSLLDFAGFSPPSFRSLLLFDPYPLPSSEPFVSFGPFRLHNSDIERVLQWLATPTLKLSDAPLDDTTRPFQGSDRTFQILAYILWSLGLRTNYAEYENIYHRSQCSRLTRTHFYKDPYTSTLVASDTRKQALLINASKPFTSSLSAFLRVALQQDPERRFEFFCFAPAKKTFHANTFFHSSMPNTLMPCADLIKRLRLYDEPVFRANIASAVTLNVVYKQSSTFIHIMRYLYTHAPLYTFFGYSMFYFYTSSILNTQFPSYHPMNAFDPELIHVDFRSTAHTTEFVRTPIPSLFDAYCEWLTNPTYRYAIGNEMPSSSYINQFSAVIEKYRTQRVSIPPLFSLYASQRIESNTILGFFTGRLITSAYPSTVAYHTSPPPNDSSIAIKGFIYTVSASIQHILDMTLYSNELRYIYPTLAPEYANTIIVVSPDSSEHLMLVTTRDVFTNEELILDVSAAHLPPNIHPIRDMCYPIRPGDFSEFS
jgi:hypothetical protein